MPKSLSERVGLAVTLVVGGLLAAVMVMVALRERDAPKAKAARGSLVNYQRQLRALGSTRAPLGPAPRSTPAPARTTPPAAPPRTSLVSARRPAPAAGPPVIRLAAVRGDCWVEAHAGDRDGKLLYAGIVYRGTSQKLRAKQVWIRLGAPEAIDATLDGKPAKLPGGTLDVLVTRAGFKEA